MTVGKSGDADLYDKQLAAFADKIGKPFGARHGIGQIQVGSGKPGWADVHQNTYGDVRHIVEEVARNYGDDVDPASALEHAVHSTLPLNIGAYSHGGLGPRIPRPLNATEINRMRDIIRTTKSTTPATTEPAHLFPLTPSLRSSALTQGFPLFEAATGVAGLGAAAAASQRKASTQTKRDSTQGKQ